MSFQFRLYVKVIISKPKVIAAREYDLSVSKAEVVWSSVLDKAIMVKVTIRFGQGIGCVQR